MGIDSNLIDPGILPSLLRQLVDVIGLDDALKLGEHFSGVKVYVPIEVYPEHPLHRILGEDSMSALVDYCGGSDLNFPKIDAATRQIKHKLIEDLTNSRMLTRDIALHTGYTERRVQQIRRERGIKSLNDDQYSMF